MWKVAKKALRWNVLFLFDAHAVLFTVRIWEASSNETRRANDIASILVFMIHFCADIGRILCRLWIFLIYYLKIRCSRKCRVFTDTSPWFINWVPCQVTNNTLNTLWCQSFFHLNLHCPTSRNIRAGTASYLAYISLRLDHEESPDRSENRL